MHISFAAAYLKICNVALGAQHSACVASDGDVYTWGNAAKGQLGFRERERERERDVYICMYMCIYMCVYICITCVYIYVCIYVYTHAYTTYIICVCIIYTYIDIVHWLLETAASNGKALTKLSPEVTKISKFRY